MYLLPLTTLLITLSSLPPVSGFWSSKTDENEQEKPIVVQPNSSPDKPVEYGVDISFPIHHATTSDNYAWLPHNLEPESHATPRKYRDMSVQPLGDTNARYKEFIEGCATAFGNKGKRCYQCEADRVAMSLRQPQSMQNYTDVGFKKIKCPHDLWVLLKDFWDKNKEKAKTEQWGVGNTYTNNWASPTTFVSVEDSGLRGGGRALKQKVWDASRDTIQEWTGEELTQTSLYGIRIYNPGAILAPHVDRLPLVSSAIINVAADLDEPWPLEVYGHDGKATNVTMEPGDMVLYESHSVIHGRPFPLKGRFVANVFVHFEPVGHSLRHHADHEGPGDVHAQYKAANDNGHGGHENQQTGLPPYILPGSPEETNWKERHPEGYQKKESQFATGTTLAHIFATEGKLENLQKHLEQEKESIHAKDKNGWQPLHEGARAGHVHIVKYLVEQGANVNETTGNGGTALWWARQAGADQVVEYLESVGALDAGPEL